MLGGKTIPNERGASVSISVAGGSILFLISITLLLAAIFQLRADALEEARRGITNLALVLGEQSTRAVQTVDLALRDLQGSISNSGAATSAAFSEAMSGPRFHRELQ